MDNQKDESLAQGHPKFDEAVKKVTEEIMAMSDEEFNAELEKHEDGDIAQFLLETGAIKLIMEELKERDKMDNPAIEVIKSRIEKLNYERAQNDDFINNYQDSVDRRKLNNTEIYKEIKSLITALEILQAADATGLSDDAKRDPA